MNKMSVQQARRYWTYLNDRAELKKQEYFDIGVYSSARKDEVRAEAEMCDAIVKFFSEKFDNPIGSEQDILHGLPAKEIAGFLEYLDTKLIEFNASLESCRRHRRDMLTKVPDQEYDRAKSIALELELQIERQIMAWEYAHKGLVSIMQEE